MNHSTYELSADHKQCGIVMTADASESGCPLEVVTFGRNVKATESPDETGVLIVSDGVKFFRLYGVAYHAVLALAKGEKGTLALAEQIVEDSGMSIGTALAAINSLKDRGIFITAGQDFDDPREAARMPTKSRNYMTLQWHLLNADRVSKLARVLTPLMRPHMIWLSLPLMLIAQMVCIFYFGSRLPLSFGSFGSSSIITLILLNYVALFLHELGHAAACKQAGHEPGPIGIGLYLIFPVMYVDVGSTWLLSRQQRLLVDAAGIYISSLLASGAWAVYLFTHFRMVGILAFLISLTAFGNLNPFIRMDGYWMLSDALGVPNLMAVNQRTSIWLLSRLIGKRVEKTPIGVEGTPMEKLYYTYLAGSVLFSIYVLLLFGYCIAPQVLGAWRARWLEASTMLSTGGSAFPVILHLLSTIYLSLPLALMLGYAVKPIILRLFRLGAKVSRPSQEVIVESHGR